MRKKVIAMLMATTMALSVGVPTWTQPVVVNAEVSDSEEEIFTTEDGLFKYVVLEDGTIELVSNTVWTETLKTLKIPESIDGKTVTSIGNNFMKDRFGDYEVYMCDLETREVSIPAGVTNIANDAFDRCSYLYAFDVDNENETYKSVDGVLFDKSGETLIKYPVAKVSDGDTYHIPDGVKNIAENALTGYGRTIVKDERNVGLYIPDSVVEVNSQIGFPFSDIQVAKENPVYQSIDGVLFDKNGEILEKYPNNKKDTEFCIPEGVKYIAEDSGDSYYLSNIQISNSLIEIKDTALFSTVESIQVAENNINYQAIDGVLFDKSGETLLIYPKKKADEKYSVPNGVKTIAEGAFADQYLLQEVTLPEDLTSIESGAFSYCYNITSLNLPDSVVNIGDNAFYYCRELTISELPDSLVYIGNQAFCNCNISMTELIIPSEVETIGAEAFYYEDYQKVKIPKSVKSIGTNAFFTWNLTAIDVDVNNQIYKSVDGVLFSADGKTLIQYPIGKEDTNYIVPKGVECIAECAFGTKEQMKIGNLEKVTLLEGVTEIGDYAFFGVWLSNCTLPASLTEIGEYAIGFAQESTIFHITGMVIYSYAGSTAEAYATENGFTFEVLTEVPSEEVSTEKPSEDTTTEAPSEETTTQTSTTENNTANTVTDSASQITISGDALPADSCIVVKTDDADSKQAAEKALKDIEMDGFVAFDITLTNKEGVKVQPNGKVTVTIPVPEALKAMKNLAIYYVDDNGKATKLASEVSDGNISFETEHFSTYVVVAEKETEVETTTIPESTKPAKPSDTGESQNPILFMTMIVFAVCTFVFNRKKNIVK